MTLGEVIKTLELAKAEVEWDYPMDYAVAIDEAIGGCSATSVGRLYREKQERKQ